MATNQNSDSEMERQLTHVIFTYFAAIDDKQLSLALYKRLFAASCAIVRPNGATTTGPSAIYESQHESFKRFRATQHTVTNMLFHKAETGWHLRANVQAMHLWNPELQDPTALESYFLAHSVLSARFIEEAAHWKIAELGIKVVWRSGSGMMAMLKT